MPRALGELICVTMNAHRNDKKQPTPWSLEDVAPWALTSEERTRIKETPVDAAAASSLRMQALAAHRAKRKESCQELQGEAR